MQRQGIHIDALKVSAVIRYKQIVAEGSAGAFKAVPGAALLVGRGIVFPGVAVFDAVPRTNGNGACRPVIGGVQGDKVDDPILRRSDQGIIQDQRAGIKSIPICPSGKIVTAAKLIDYLVLDKIHGIHIGYGGAFFVFTHDSLAYIQHGTAFRIQRGGAQHGYAHGNGIPGLIPRDQIIAVNVAVGRGIEHLYKVFRRFVLFPDSQSGEHFGAPLYKQGLPRPAGACHISQLSNDLAPLGRQRFQGDGNIPFGKAVSVAAAAKGGHACHAAVSALCRGGKG